MIAELRQTIAELADDDWRLIALAFARWAEARREAGEERMGIAYALLALELAGEPVPTGPTLAEALADLTSSERRACSAVFVTEANRYAQAADVLARAGDPAPTERRLGTFWHRLAVTFAEADDRERRLLDELGRLADEEGGKGALLSEAMADPYQRAVHREALPFVADAQAAEDEAGDGGAPS